MKPKFPILSIDKGGLDIIKKENYLSSVTVLKLLNSSNKQECYEIDTNMTIWTYELNHSNFKPTPWVKFLANTSYNPITDSEITWNKEGIISIEELKKIIYRCIDQDDDILTQFIAGEIIKDQLKSADSFESICQVLNKLIFEFDDEKLRKEFGD